ncbi:MAG: PEP-CTERM sorting domain-containing protein [Akkermansiaceae bacterium]|nr:PEP-CTERM sorting domain-containing protein [Akkermansiaceae bacterium]
MNKTIKSSLIALAGLAVCASSASAVATANGDLLIGFYQLNAAGDAFEPNTYVFNLGAAATFRENTLTGVSVSTINPGIASSNIGAELATAFGANWAESGNVRWGVVGGLDQTTVGLVGGELQGTSYVSRAATAYQNAPSSAGPTGVNGTSRSFLRNNIEAFRVGSNNVGTDIGNDAGALITTISSISTFEDFVPLAGSSQFGIAQNILGDFTAGNIDGQEGSLDIWRLVNAMSSAALASSGTDLTSGLGTGNAVLQTGQFIGTLNIDGAGNLTWGAVPEPSSALLLGVLGMMGIARRNRSAK